jgi:hypothetical protein
MQTYKIVRYYLKGNKRTIKRGLTLEQAQDHCSKPETSGSNWFDGYTEDN